MAKSCVAIRADGWKAIFQILLVVEGFSKERPMSTM